MNIFKAAASEVMVPIHPAGWPFIFFFVVVSFAITWFWQPFALPGTLLCMWCVYFFRNPVRVTPLGEGLVVAPADGRVLHVESAEVPEDLDLPRGEWRRVAIFMNVFDTHVNRAPVSGRVTAASYSKGRFFNASLDKSSLANERQNMVLCTTANQSVGVVQIAGLVARRIVFETAVGASLEAGQQFGIIRFGSRVDVWIPASTPVLVLPGQRAVAGETPIADLSSRSVEPESSRRG